MDKQFYFAQKKYLKLIKYLMNLLIYYYKYMKKIQNKIYNKKIEKINKKI